MARPDPETARLRFLRIALARPHRFRRRRALTMGLTFAVLWLVPWTGLARFDAWGGAHRALGAPVGAAQGLAAVVVAIAAFYVATFLINAVAGRMFCGFGCPVGQLSRLGDAVDAWSGRPERKRAWLSLVAFAFGLAVATLSWWMAPDPLLAGEAGAAAAAAGTVVVAVGISLLHARRIRWEFCRKACPIGLYYSMTQTTALVRVGFDADADCSECEACGGICPVRLDPRHLDDLLPSPGGIAFEDLPAKNHCLHCGACIEICEHMNRKGEGPAPLGFRRPPRTSTAPVDDVRFDDELDPADATS